MTAIGTGTIIFLVLWVVSSITFRWIAMSKTKEKSNKSDSGKIALISCTIASFCMWIMWVSTYMHQMNPLIYPTVKTETK